MQSLALLGLFTAPILATKLLLPLYEYPEDGSWTSIYNTIETNPGLTFQVIINVDSGPGGSAPNSDFAEGTAKLNSYPNVETLGYVHTLFGDASLDEVNKNVSDWYSWNEVTSSNVSIQGIFFDEVHNTEGDDTDVTYMQSLVTSAISTFGSSQCIRIFNPGSKPEHLEFYELADYVVVFETYASEYSASVLSENVPAGYANQSAILIPDFASVGTATEAESWLQSMVSAGIASAHILNYDYLQSTSTDNPAAIGSIASALAGMQGASSSTSPSSSGTTTSAASTTTSAKAVTTTSAKAVTTTISAAATTTTTAASESDGDDSWDDSGDDSEDDSGDDSGNDSGDDSGDDPADDSGDDSGDDSPTSSYGNSSGGGRKHHHSGRCTQNKK